MSGIGLVIEIFQATSLPFTEPSKISPSLPSADWVPVNAPPLLFSESVASRIAHRRAHGEFPISINRHLLSSPALALNLGRLKPI